MTQDEIIEMAKQSGLFEITKDGYEVFYPDNLEAFTKLVAAKEREACLNICKAQASTNYWEGADVCAEAIQARGEA